MIGRYAAKLCFVMILIGLAGMVESIQKSREDRAFLNYALTALAEPSGAVAKGERYQGDLIFFTKSGGAVTIPATKVPLSVRDSFRFVKSVEIKYLPQDPAAIRFSDWNYTSPNQFFQSGMFFVVGLVAFWILRKNRN